MWTTVKEGEREGGKEGDEVLRERAYNNIHVHACTIYIVEYTCTCTHTQPYMYIHTCIHVIWVQVPPEAAQFPLEMNALKCRTLSATRARTLKLHIYNAHPRIADCMCAFNGAVLDLCNRAQFF